MKEQEWWGLLLVAITLFYANLSGTTSGGLVVPLTISFMSFDVRNAIALSNSSIFVASAIRLVSIFNESHPKKNGTGLLVDHNIVVLSLPLIVMGTVVGVLANIVLPTVIIIGVYVVGCVCLSFSMYCKATKMHAEEDELR